MNTKMKKSLSQQWTQENSEESKGTESNAEHYVNSWPRATATLGCTGASSPHGLHRR